MLQNKKEQSVSWCPQNHQIQNALSFIFLPAENKDGNESFFPPGASLCAHY